ncbi:acyltransferase family protein [Micromonosporaceae bacterium Da 78-11]
MSEPAPPSVGGAVRRMAWLDGLRAVAALLVVYAHLSRYLFRGARDFSSEWLHAGPAGVLLFFLVSGYIIPASLERRGSLRSFWIGRLGRLFPLYAVVIAAVLLLAVGGLVTVDPQPAAHPGTAAVAHLTMLPQLLGVAPVTPVLWTLTFEMAFYLLVSALFAIRVRRADGWVAVVFAVTAVVAAPLVARLPVGGSALVLTAAVVLTGGLVAMVSGRRRAVVAGGLLLGAGVVVLLLAGQAPAHAWDGLLIIAVMFAGTTIYRADHGQTSWWRAGFVLAVVAAALLTNWYAELASLAALTPRYLTRSVLTLLVFGGAFAVGMLTRGRRVPRPLAWLGLVSYSVYLVHYVLIQALAPVLTGLGDRLPALAEAPVVVAYLGLVVGVSAVTHRFVEVPGQRLGRRGIRWATARWGPDGRRPPESPQVSRVQADNWL